MKLALVTDAWFPQVNGVVRTLDTVSRTLIAQGHQVKIISPDQFRTIPCPTYPEIRLSVLPGRKLSIKIDEFQPDAVHIATEGPLGIAAAALCRRKGWPFTTSFHTKFAEYIHQRLGVPTGWSYAAQRRFHNRAARTMVATPSLERELAARGFHHLVHWTRGVDTALFYPRPNAAAILGLDLPRPLHLFVGRVAIEKNIEAFLRLDLPGSKMIVGDGPQRTLLAVKYPNVHFAGNKTGEALAQHYAAADVFVFPSLTDTFGLVLLEALASGLPVAAFPVTGPQDVLTMRPTPTPIGALDNDLSHAIEIALTCSKDAARNYAEQFSWHASAAQFLSNLAPFETRVLSSAFSAAAA